MTIVEAREQDLEVAIWQCFAQMMGARIFNERHRHPIEEVYGCITDGHVWQFLRLVGDRAEIDNHRHYFSGIGSILAAFDTILKRHAEGFKAPEVTRSHPSEQP